MSEEIRSSFIRVFPFVIVLTILFFRIKQKKINPLDLYINKPNSIFNYLLWVIGFLLFALSIEFIFYKLGILEIDPWNHTLVSSIIRITGAVLLAPVMEELIFRGIILNLLLKKKLNIHLAIFIQACLFVLVHNFTYQFTLSSNIAVVQSLIDASLYGYARHYTKSIYTPMTMHMSGNLIATLERFVF